MRWRPIVLALGMALAQLALAKHKHDQPPKPLPLPPQPPMALAAETQSLEFRITPLLARGGLGAQISTSFRDLIRDTHGERIVKVRALVAGAGDPRLVSEKASQIFTERKLPLPVVSILQVGALGGGAAEVVIEAVVESKRVLNPHGLAFFSGQRASSLQEAIERLAESARAASIPSSQILTSTCFVSTVTNRGSMRAALLKAFPQASIAIVQPLRVPIESGAMCEAVGRLSAAPRNGPVEVLKNARVALVDSPQLIFTGLQLSFGNYLDDAHQAFARLKRDASAVRPIGAPVEMDAFALDSYSASALLRTSTAPPATFTVQTVEGLPAIDASAGIEAIFTSTLAASGTESTVPK